MSERMADMQRFIFQKGISALLVTKEGRELLFEYLQFMEGK
jgi:hypothetical protein